MLPNEQCKDADPREDRLNYIRLALIPGIGPRMMGALLEYFGSATAVLAATLRQLGEVERIGPKLATAIRDASHSSLADRVIEHCQEHDVRIFLPSDRDFPRLLKELPDPPPILFVRGGFKVEDQLSIAIVGSRHPTAYGKQVAAMLARGLSHAGLTIVSGLARGIDGVAHRTAMEVGGRTLALLGSSVTSIYPPEHVGLANDVTKQGAIISETHPFAQPKSGVFPQRNRLISGLSLGVIVVEAADRSGALITAGHAGEQGRDLFAVPGPITSRMSRGTNRLLRDGAVLVRDAQDVLEHLGPLVEAAQIAPGKSIHHPAELQLNEVEQTVLQVIRSDPTDVDQIVVESGVGVPRVLSTLSVLEMRGLIRRTSGRHVCRR